jgi:hypothetical protein
MEIATVAAVAHFRRAPAQVVGGEPALAKRDPFQAGDRTGDVDGWSVAIWMWRNVRWRATSDPC